MKPAVHKLENVISSKERQLLDSFSKRSKMESSELVRMLLSESGAFFLVMDARKETKVNCHLLHSQRTTKPPAVV